MQYTTFPSSNTLVTSNRSIIHGFAIRATVTVVINIYDATSATGTPVFRISGPTTDTVFYDSTKGIPFNNGIFIEIASGTASGSIFWE